ncbi:MAG: MobA protein [Odoribacter sp.]|nr:MobA protein [Odoribacter sp.]
MNSTPTLKEKRKWDKAIHTHIFRLNEKEHTRFMRNFSESGIKTKTRYLKHLMFDKEIKVIKIDKYSYEYYNRLTKLYLQYRAVGVNYNQVVKALKANFSEKKAKALLYKLEKCTRELNQITQNIIHITQEYESRWFAKSQ